MIFTIILAILIVGGTVLLYKYYDMAEAKVLGEQTNEADDAQWWMSGRKGMIASAVVGALMAACFIIPQFFGVREGWGFHGWWSSIVTLFPLAVFALLSVNVYQMLERGDSIMAVTWKFLFLLVADALAFAAGVIVVAVTIFLLILIAVLWFALKLLATSGSGSSRSSYTGRSSSGSQEESSQPFSTAQGYDVTIEGGGIGGGDVRARRNIGGSLTDEHGRTWTEDAYGNATRD
ncbi:MAG: hypothetical protein IJP82_09365 [Bacteroidaceae bacterium]|nr:hypothetical protein [Bacteroidaceae bacterium]